MKRLFPLIAVLVITASCQKDETTEPKGISCDTGNINFINNSSNPYYIYINDDYKGAQNGGTSFKETLSKGRYRVSVEQKSGYVLYPTILEYDVELKGCDTKVISYP